MSTPRIAIDDENDSEHIVRPKSGKHRCTVCNELVPNQFLRIRCSVCERGTYCGYNCYLKDWPEHCADKCQKPFSGLPAKLEVVPFTDNPFLIWDADTMPDIELNRIFDIASIRTVSPDDEHVKEIKESMLNADDFIRKRDTTHYISIFQMMLRYACVSHLPLDTVEHFCKLHAYSDYRLLWVLKLTDSLDIPLLIQFVEMLPLFSAEIRRRLEIRELALQSMFAEWYLKELASVMVFNTLPYGRTALSELDRVALSKLIARHEYENDLLFRAACLSDLWNMPISVTIAEKDDEPSPFKDIMKSERERITEWVIGSKLLPYEG